MTYDLYIGDRSFSSWSLRGWLMFEKFGLPYRTHMMGLYSDTFDQDMRVIAPARTVPAMRDPDGVVVADTLAMAETLAETHPDAGLWPKAAATRAFARWIVAEMHSGFSPLRTDCPMQLLHQVDGFAPSQAVINDLERLETLWAAARDLADGPWLLGDYSLADVFYAPVAARIAGYNLPMGDASKAYVNQVLSDDAFRQWRAMGLTVTYDPMPYDLGPPISPWLGPKIRTATPSDMTSENAQCPYSGDPVTHMLMLEGRVFGFCNAFCRDKTLHDPDAWPQFRALFGS